ncbi:MAG: signal recognition particle protein [Candidatus Anoxymicrobium japonicum]|uniref:Signal recognition particle protein n=1 Tax=Candidatus Anoxymicrobium japonicum TaxID=2013648 RepID=A0A2N3G7X3_9ACTN|nr:MAG: signal recognition particle protein [Candidatus Anoxymicrobium japonicum]
MFESLGDRLQDVFAKLRSRGKLSEKDVDVAMREIRLVLLEADVNFKVVKLFVDRVRERAIGEEVVKSITPAQQVVKIVYDEMTEILGGKKRELEFAPHPPSIIMLVGLQGSGKTTAAAKLAVLLRNQGRNPMLVAADVYRPAAVEQLQALGSQIGVPVAYFKHKSALEITEEAVREAARAGNDVLILDTAGRLHIDEEMMQELADIKDSVSPSETMLVVDAMTGQDAVNVANAFLEKIGFEGILVTKMDGDARGGAALSMKSVTGRPIKFASTGEKMNDIEVFHPDRVASRILGMGDVVTLVEKAEGLMTEEKARKMEEKLRKQKFDFNDFLDQMQQLKKMGGLSKVLEMVPGMSGLSRAQGINVDDNHLKKIEAIIHSMTNEERAHPNMLNGSRKRRVAAGSGTSTQDVNQLTRQFAQMQKMLKTFSGKGANMGALKRLFPF